MTTQAKGLKRRFFIRTLAISLTASVSTLAVTPALAQNAAPMALNIPAQPISDAVRTLARQTGTQILFDNDRLSRIRSRPVHDVLTARQALRVMLEGSGFEVAETPSGALVIRPTSPVLGEAEAGGVAADSEGAHDQTIIVTGTNIRGATPVGSQLLTYNREDFVQAGATTTEQFLRTVPQNFGSVGSATNTTQNNTDPSANGSFGANANLRGIGPGATLTLVNGVRFAPSGAQGANLDITMIPLSAIERVDILTDGASAIYGADAVAGVVNFITRRNFSGAETAGSYRWTADGGAAQYQASQLFGIAGRAGHLLAAYEYYRQDELSLRQRPYLVQRTGDFFIEPRLERHSLFADASLRLTDSLRIVGTFMGSDRDFLNDRPQGAIQLRTDGTSKSRNGTLGLEADIFGDWQLTLTGNYGTESVTSETIRVATSAVLVRSSYSSELYGVRAIASGTLLDTASGRLRGSIGAETRHESFDYSVVGGRLTRRVISAFGELSYPLIGSGSGRPGLERLEVSAAGRIDDYDDEGSAFTPKLGVIWELTPGFSFRSSFANSFRVAPLATLSSFAPGFSYQVYTFPDPASPTGTTRTIFNTAPGNPDLRPERSTSFTVGLDLRPPSVPGLEMSLTFYRISYRGRISTPPISALSQFFLNLPLLEPFLTRSPAPAVIQQIFANNVVFEQAPAQGAAGVQALVDYRLQNLARSLTQGVDINLSYALETNIGRVRLDAAGALLLTQDVTPVEGGPTRDLLNKAYRPAEFRSRATASWSHRGFGAFAALNYVDGYINDVLTPPVPASSWITADLGFSYTTGTSIQNSLLRGWSFNLAIVNALNERPPFVQNSNFVTNIGYDSANANALGRSMTFSISKRW